MRGGRQLGYLSRHHCRCTTDASHVGGVYSFPPVQDPPTLPDSRKLLGLVLLDRPQLFCDALLQGIPLALTQKQNLQIEVARAGRANQV